MGKNYTLFNDEAGMKVPEAVNGMHVCAALAKIDPENVTSEIYSW